MAFQAEEMLQYLNYAAIGIIGLAAFWGFVQGFYKSTFFLIWTVGVLVLAYFMMPVVSAFLMTQDISMVEQYYQAEVPITNLKETIPALLISMEPALANVLVDGSDALALVYGMTQMVLQLVFLIVVLVLNATVFKVVGWILWLIFKPKGKKKKKSGLSRLLGTGVGTLRGAFSILLMSIPIAGLVAFSGALDLAMTQQADAAPTYQLMLINDEMVLVEVQQPQAEQDEMIEEVQQFLSEYRSTYVGMIAGYVKINDIALDEYVFDSIFEVTVKTDNVDTSIKFRAELEKALEAVNLLVEANDGSTTFDDTIIYKLSPEDVTAIMGLVSDLDLIEVIIPVGLEYLLNSGEFDEMLEGYEDLFVLEDLKAIDYMQDLGVLGDVFADALTLIQAQSDVPLSDINYFMFDGEVVTDIFANLGQLEMLQYGLPIGLNYALGMPDVEAMLLEQGVTKADLTLPEGADLQGDFEAIADLYLAIQGLGFDSMDDFETLQDPAVFGAITDQAIADVFDALFAFNMVNDNTAVVSGLIYDQMIANLPEDYQGLITEADINANFNATEITNLVLLAKVVVSTGILTLLEEENPDYTTVLSDANIDAIVAKISGSNLISTKMNDVIGSLLTQLNLGVTLVIPPTIDWGSESGQTELTALLKATREILSADILGGDLSLLTNESIDALAGYLSDSYVIRYNLNAIFEMVSTEANLGDFEIVLPETVEEWTELEINSLLKAAKILSSAGSDPSALIALSKADIHTIALSKVISNTFEAVFMDMVATGGDLEGQIFVPTGLTWYSTSTENGELENLLLALKVLVPGGDIATADFGFDAIIAADIDLLLASKVIEHTAVLTVQPMIETGSLTNYIEPTLPGAVSYVWYQGVDLNHPDGDLKPLLKSIQTLDGIGISLTTFDYTAFSTVLAVEANIQVVNDAMLESRILHNSLDKMFNQFLITQGGLAISPIDSSNDPDFWRGDGVNEGELVLVLKAINAADYFQSTDLTTINGTNSADLKAALNKINNSAILRPILGEIMDSAALSSASAWKVTPQPTLTKAEWTTEIDVLVDLLVELNGGFSLSSINITNMTDPEADELGVILKLVAQSRLLDIEVISSFMKSGIESAFGTTLTTPLGEVVDTPYATKVAAWNTPTTGEVDRLVAVIKGLSDIQPVSSLNPVGDYQGDYTDANLLGGFFNTMKLSTVIGPIVPELVLVVTPDAYESNLGTMDSSTDYQELLRQFSDDAWYAILNP